MADKIQVTNPFSGQSAMLTEEENKLYLSIKMAELTENYTFMQNTNPNKFFLESAKDFFKENNFNYFENSEKMSDLYNDPMKYIIKIDFHPNKDGVELIYQSLREEVNKILLN